MAGRLLGRGRCAGLSVAIGLVVLMEFALPIAPTIPGLAVGTPAKGINMEPSMRPWRYLGLNPDGWWDPVDGPRFISQEMPLLQALGVATVRLEFPWWAIEQTGKGQFNWSRADAIVGAAEGYRLHLAPVLVWTPRWATPACPVLAVGCSTPGGKATCASQPPPAPDFGDFVRAVASRYRGRIHSWEMWNEPDLPQYFNGTPAEYAQHVLVPGYDAVKVADPSAAVVFGGPSFSNLPWIQGVLAAGGANHFDVMAFHFYGDPRATLAAARAVAKLAPGKPLWLGEWGVPDRGGGAQQSLILSVLTVISPLAAAQWYALRDDYAMAGPGQICASGYWGLVSHDYLRKPSYTTFAGAGGFPLLERPSASGETATESPAAPAPAATVRAPAPGNLASPAAAEPSSSRRRALFGLAALMLAVSAGLVGAMAIRRRVGAEGRAPKIRRPTDPF